MHVLKLGVDAAPLSKISGGIGFYLFYILDEIVRLRSDVLFVLYTTSKKGDFTHFEQYANVQIRPISSMANMHSLWIQTTLASAVWKDDLDYFWGSAQYIPLITKKKLKTIISLYDFVYLFFPESVSRMKCWCMKMLSKKFFDKADYIFSISQGTADKLRELIGIEGSDIVIPPIKKSISYKTKEECYLILAKNDLVHKNFALTVGSIEPRKNLLELMDFYEKLLQLHDPSSIYPLVIVGGGGWKNKAILKKIKDLTSSYPDNLLHLGFVTDRDLSCLYSSAAFFVSLSVYEGYGMPLAESRTCNTPVVCFNLPEMREAAENDGVFLNKDDYKNELSRIFKVVPYEERELNRTYPSNTSLAAKIAVCIKS